MLEVQSHCTMLQMLVACKDVIISFFTEKNGGQLNGNPIIKGTGFPHSYFLKDDFPEKSQKNKENVLIDI